MNRFIVAVLAFITVVGAVPVSAASGEQRSAWSLGDILNQGSRLLTETITQGLAMIQDRIEMDATTTPGSDGKSPPISV
jgi:hypothetical protein